MKICITCKKEKLKSEFNKNRTKSDGLQNVCKSCVKEYNVKNKDSVARTKKIRNIKNADAIKLRYKENKDSLREYYISNRERIIERQKKYNAINSDKIRKYKKENKDRFNQYNLKHHYSRVENDSLYVMICRLRSAVRKAFKKNGYTKKSKTYEILGCSFEEFKEYIENQFVDGMTWNNHGKWHLDHIYPVSKAIDEEHLIKLNHYTNFQPLWAIDNIKKSNKILVDC